MRSKSYILILSFLFVSGCSDQNPTKNVDYLIVGGLVYNGENKEPEKRDIGICNNIICFIGIAGDHIKATRTINANGLTLTPGFIDPHTHSLEELSSENKNANLNYLTQGVTTVITGNDGGGTPYIAKLRQQLTDNGIGTNVGMLVGHGKVREIAMGRLNEKPTDVQLETMKQLVEQAFKEGALGFSTGLYYVPGRYSATEEVIELAKIAAKYDSIYESHIRDESTFNIGFLNAVKEVIEIAKKAKLPAHIAHIKALGVDVWGQSAAAINMINKARSNGLKITADQYPWQASGTFLHSAVIPAWVMADSHEIYLARLVNSKLLPKIKTEITENIRRRGGAKALLITASQNKNWLGKTLQEIAIANGTTAAETVIVINLLEKVRVASFNMSSEDIESFMVQDWVVSSSDGTNGHPRKFASFPQKYQEYVVKKRVLTVQEFIHKSTAKTADIFSIKDRGYLKQGYKADINLIDLKEFQPKASFSNWNLLSTGVRYQFINGVLVIDNNIYSEQLPGEVL